MWTDVYNKHLVLICQYHMCRKISLTYKYIRVKLCRLLEIVRNFFRCLTPDLHFTSNNIVTNGFSHMFYGGLNFPSNFFLMYTSTSEKLLKILRNLTTSFKISCLQNFCMVLCWLGMALDSCLWCWVVGL